MNYINKLHNITRLTFKTITYDNSRTEDYIDYISNLKYRETTKTKPLQTLLYKATYNSKLFTNLMHTLQFTPSHYTLLSITYCLFWDLPTGKMSQQH